jgi:hypothetical protein
MDEHKCANVHSLDRDVTLTHAGFQGVRSLESARCRKEIRHVEESKPTIDNFESAKFRSDAPLKEWLTAHAPTILR